MPRSRKEREREESREQLRNSAKGAETGIRARVLSPGPLAPSSPPDEVRRSHTERRSVSERRSETPTIAVQTEPRSAGEPRSLTGRGSGRITVDWVDGYLQIPNYIVDRLLPLLTQDEATVYMRLYRLAQYREGGKPRGWCAIGAPKLMELTKIRRTALFVAIASLEQKGLIQREAQEICRGKGGGRGSGGNRYRVLDPHIEGRPASERRSDSERRSPGGHMKLNNERKYEKASAADAAPPDVYKIRERALRIRQAGTGVGLRAAVISWLIGEGHVVDEGLVDEAIRVLSE